jgi:rhodanese-related sulfurtransferase
VPLRPIRILIISAAGLACGLAWNTWGGSGMPIRANAFLREGAAEIDVSVARARFDKGALFLDARPLANYKMSHIPKALPLPEDDFDRHFAELEPRLRSSFDTVVYCAGYGCEASHLVAAKLHDRGIQAEILNEGWPAWTEAGHPVKEGAEP